MNRKYLNRSIGISVFAIVIVVLSSTLSFAGSIDTSATIDMTLANEAKPIGDKLTGALKVIGTFVAVGTTMYIGIKYMLGSAEERAEYKKTMLPYFVGAILIFATTQFVNFISKLVN